MAKTKLKKDKTKPTEKKRIPANLLAPVYNYLVAKLSDLTKHRKKISAEDPYKDEERLSQNASPDDDAYEQSGHVRTNALKHEIDRKTVQIRKAISRLKIGKYGYCENCGKFIDTDRLTVYPEATLCVDCQKERE